MLTMITRKAIRYDFAQEEEVMGTIIMMTAITAKLKNNNIIKQ